MSCFWDSLTQALTNEELKVLEIKRNTLELIKIIKIVNKLTPNVLWQGKSLSPKEMKENHEHVKNYDSKTYNQGYMTSSADPFLILFAELFGWNITFNYNHNRINIKHKKPIRSVFFRASRSHFSVGR